MAGLTRSIGEVWFDVKPNVKGVAGAVNQQLNGVGGTFSENISEEIVEGVEKGGKEASKSAEDAGSKSGKAFGEKFKGGINIASAAIVGTAVAGFTGLVAVGETFDAVSDNIRSGTGASGAALDDMMNSVKTVASVVPASFDAVGTTVADLNTRLGLSGKELETISAQVLEAGRIFGEEIDISTMSGAFSAFGIEGAALEGAMDKMFTASQATGVSMNELANIAEKVAPEMKGLGYSFEETVGLVGTLDKAGMDASKVAGSMGKALVNLAKDGEKPQEAFRRALGELDGFVKKGDELKANELAIKIFGTKGSVTFLNALKNGTVNMSELDKIAASTSDTIMGVSKETESFSQVWKTFTNRLTVAIEPVASKAFDLVGEALDKVIPKVEAALSWIEDNIDLVKNIGIWVGGIAVGILALNTALTAYTAVMGLVKIATGAWAAVQWLLNAAMLANPTTWIILAIVAGVALLVGAIWLVKTNWEPIMAWFTETFNGLGGMISGWLTTVGGFFTSVGGSIGEWWTGMTSGISTLFGGAINGIKGFFSIIGTLWDTAMAVIGNGIQRIGQGIQDVFKGIGNFFIGIANVIIDSVNVIIDAINGLHVKVPDWKVAGVKVFGDANGKSFGPNLGRLGSIPMLATGADILGPTIAMLGEGGQPETVVNRGVMNENLELMNARMEADSGGGGNTIQVYAAPGMDEEMLAEKVVRVLNRNRRR